MGASCFPKKPLPPIAVELSPKMALLLPQHNRLILPPQPRMPLFLYSVSVMLCAFLFYMSAFYCQLSKCHNPIFVENTKIYDLFQYFPMLISPMIASMSVLWFVLKVFYPKSICALIYSFMVGWEMPCAVFCSLLAGISAVIIIHYSFDYVEEKWSEEWSIAAAAALLLGAVHAILAFALQ